MKRSQLNQGQKTRLMYVECKGGDIDGACARIGWVSFSKTGRSVYYRGRTLSAIGGQGVSGNFVDAETGLEYWVSGVKRTGSNLHPNERGISFVVDEDARAALASLQSGA